MRKITLIFLSILMIISLGSVVFIGRAWLLETRRTNLNGFYELTRSDPLFYSPFFQTEDWTEAIAGLKNEEGQLKEAIIDNLMTSAGSEPARGIGKDEYIQFLRKNDIFPYQFLEDLILINQKTNEFLKSPSSELGQNLLELYDRAADAYLQNISAKIAILKKTTNNESTPPAFFFFVDSASSLEVKINDYQTIKENGDELKKETAKRKNCFLGKENCEALSMIKNDNSFVTLIDSSDSPLNGGNIDFIKDTFLFEYSGHGNTLKELKGPYKINSFCWQNPNFEQWLYLAFIERNGRTFVLPKLANQNYYQKTPAEPITNLDKALIKNGIKFLTQLETTDYECPNLTFYPQLITLDFLKEKIKTGSINKGDLENNSDYKLLIENQFGLMAPAINTTSFVLKIWGLYERINKNTNLNYLLGVRTDYSLFYLPFAKSIWRIDKELQYFVPKIKNPSSGSSRIITLDELEKLGYTKEDIKKIHAININEFISSLLKE